MVDYEVLAGNALSAELSRMSHDGLIEVHRNHFKLNDLNTIQATGCTR